jgi:protein tyrosine/serine phosphatase
MNDFSRTARGSRFRLHAVFWGTLFLAIAVTAQASGRDPDWAQPLHREGVPNFYRVSANLYRSAQPDADGMKALKDMGIRTVVNLRAFHSDHGLLAGTGLDSEHIYMKTWHPEEEDVVRFLRIVTDPARQPVLVHCQHGSDRTGMMVAFYRVIVQGWSKQKAAREMTEGGYGFHEIWQNLVHWLDQANLSRIRREAGLAKKGALLQ